MRVFPKSNDQCLYKKAMQPQKQGLERCFYKPKNTRDCQPFPEAIREAEDIFCLRDSRKTQPCQNFDFQLLASRNHQVCVICQGSPQKLIHEGPLAKRVTHLFSPGRGSKEWCRGYIYGVPECIQTNIRPPKVGPRRHSKGRSMFGYISGPLGNGGQFCAIQEWVAGTKGQGSITTLILRDWAVFILKGDLPDSFRGWVSQAT